MISFFLVFFALVIVKGFLSCMEASMKTIQRRMIFSDNENDKNNYNSDNFDKFIVAVNVFKSIIVMFFGVFSFYGAKQIALKVCNESDLIIYYLSIAVILILMFYIIVVFGGFIPRKAALKAPKNFMRFGMMPVKFIYYLFFVVFFPFVKISSFLNKLFKIDLKVRDDDITQEEIMMMIDAGGEKGAIDDDEREMIANVFEFDDKNAGDIVTHRKDIVAISIDSNVDDIMKVVLEEKYSRIPVYKDSIDNIVGILYIKDFMKHLILFDKSNFNLKRLLMEPYFVPFSKKTDELFKEMQENKVHLAIVLDEYGGTLGIVSMEDLIEEVMGNILDEYDVEEQPEVFSNDGINFYIDGRADYKEVFNYLGLSIDEDENNEEYDTISGFFIGKMGHIPEKNEFFKFETDEFSFFTEKVEENRISLIKAVKKQQAFEESEAAS